MTKRSRRKFLFAVLIQASLGLLDVIGVLLSGAIGALASTSLTHLATPAPILRLLNVLHLTHLDPSNTMIILSFCALGFFLLKTLLALFFTRKTFHFLAHQQSQLSSSLLSEVLGSDYIWLRKQDPHFLATTLVQGMGAVTVNALGQIMLLVAESAMVLFFFVILLAVNPVIALSTLLYLFFVLYALNSLIGKRVAGFNEQLAKLRLESQINIFNALKLFREIRVLRRVKWFQVNIDSTLTKQADFFSNDIWVQQIPKYALEVALLVGASGLLLIGKFAAGSNQILPILAIYLVGAARIFPSLLRIQSSLFSLRAYSYLSQTAHQLLEYFAKKTNINAHPTREELGKAMFGLSRNVAENVTKQVEVGSSRIQLRKLAFSFPNSEKNVLQDLSFKIEPGERVAIVGPSGAGKSTLCDLFLGLLVPTAGQLDIGGSPAAKWIAENIGKVSYLPQEITLISGSLLENICLGLDEGDIDFEKVTRAIAQAQLSELLSNLPLGLNTHLGVSGINLSGGQKQRIGIARALYSDPNIVIMDEATSALDAETEHAIMSVLESLGEETIVIFIAHRLSSIRNFPRIMYFEEGHLLHDGTFSEVRANVPRFDRQVRLLGVQ